jgi:hypothetical protein
VRSYYHADVIWGVNRNNTAFTLASRSGGLAASMGRGKGDVLQIPDWGMESFPTTYAPSSGLLGFRFLRDVSTTAVVVPYWFLAACSFALAALFAFKRSWRFSVRSILIATTLLAIALGLGVYFL